MQLVLSETRFSEIIRQLEGINDSDEEINVRFEHYTRKFFDHLREYGVNIGISPLKVAGKIGTFQADLNPIHSNDDRATRINGISMLNPVSVTVQECDLPALFADRMLLATMELAWPDYQPRLQNISLAELAPTLEDAATKAFLAPTISPTNPMSVVDAEEGYQYWLQKAGRKDPLEKFNAIEAHRQAEEAAYKARQDAALDALILGGEQA